MQASGICNSDLQVKWLQHLSVAECVIQFWRKGLSASEMLRCVHSMGVQDAVGAHPGSTNVDSNVPLLSIDDLVYGDMLPENAQR